MSDKRLKELRDETCIRNQAKQIEQLQALEREWAEAVKRMRNNHQGTRRLNTVEDFNEHYWSKNKHA